MRDRAFEERAEELLKRVATTADDSAANELLSACFAGFPVHRLVHLFDSDQESVVKAGAWIASELGAKAAPLMPQVRSLLTHSSRYVRFFALDIALTSSTKSDGETVAAAIELIQDSDTAVRWKAMGFLSRAQAVQLEASQPYLKGTLVNAVAWLLGPGLLDGMLVVERLADGERTWRLFAAVAAVRSGVQDQHALEQAAVATDPDVNSFAREELERLRKYPSRRQS